MARNEYFELLKDPRWQRRRLEIFKRDDFACQICLSKTETLHVHHNFYVSGRLPWEYADECLVTLCASCHDEVTEKIARLRELLTQLQPWRLSDVCGYVYGQIEFAREVRITEESVSSEAFGGFCDSVLMTGREVAYIVSAVPGRTVAPHALRQIAIDRERARRGDTEDHYEDVLS